MNGAPNTELPVVRAAELADGRSEPAWLFEGLWSESAVGLIGGFPKVGKSWLGLEMAISLASGRPCLDVYAVDKPALALLYMAEDSAPVVRQRLEAICRHRGLELAALPIYVITADVLRLDGEHDQRRLWRTVEQLRPKMVLLDPLVRCHTIDENSAAEVSALLGYFRQLQRAFDTAVVLVHHCRKNGSSNHPGHSLRGSGDWYAAGDSYLYLRRTRERLVLTFEHRAAPAPEPVEVTLAAGDDPHLEVVGPASTASRGDDLGERVLQCLARTQPMTRTALRDRLGVRNSRLGAALNELQAQHRIQRGRDGFGLVERSGPLMVQGERNDAPTPQERTGARLPRPQAEGLGRARPGRPGRARPFSKAG